MESKLSIHRSHGVVNKIVTELLLASSICVFAGRAYQHFFYDIPIRFVLWNQNIMQGFVTDVLGIAWDVFIRSAVWDHRIQLVVQLLGVLYLLCVLACILIRRSMQMGWILALGSLFLFLLAVLYSLDSFGRVGEFLEYTCQWVAPAALALAVSARVSYPLWWILRFSVALTFAGHGLYAVGYYAIPGHFIDMMMAGFGVGQLWATRLLIFAGWMDFLVALLILFPFTVRYAAMYAFVWGTLTAVARVWVNFDADFATESLSQWIFQTLVRVPNALIPLAVYFMARVSREPGHDQGPLIKTDAVSH